MRGFIAHARRNRKKKDMASLEECRMRRSNLCNGISFEVAVAQRVVELSSVRMLSLIAYLLSRMSGYLLLRQAGGSGTYTDLLRRKECLCQCKAPFF